MKNEGIADFRYRGYRGERTEEDRGWWVIARRTMKETFKKKGYWIVTVLASYYYLALLAVLYFVDQFRQAALGGGGDASDFEGLDLLQNIDWAGHMLNGWAVSALFWMILTLIGGAGLIANDNRANAMLVYMAKLGHKSEYLRGKWLGLFIPLLVSMALPATVFYAYGAMTYSDYGFISKDPTAFLRLLVVIIVAAGVHASVMLGVSSLFRQGRMAGAAYAGLFILTGIVSTILTGLVFSGNVPSAMQGTVKTLSYWSFDGLLQGFAKVVMGTDGVGAFDFGNQMTDQPMIERPHIAVVLIPLLILVAASLYTAWVRVRAVEVVK